MRRACGDQYLAPRQGTAWAGTGWPACLTVEFFNGRKDVGGFAHPARAIFTAGHVAFIRAGHQHTVALESVQIAPGCRMLPHAHVHGRGNQYRLVGRQQGCGCEIVGLAGCHPGHQVRCRRRHHHKVGNARQLNMSHLCFVGQIEKMRIGFLAGQPADRKRCDELLAAASENRRNRHAGLFAKPDQFK